MSWNRAVRTALPSGRKIGDVVRLSWGQGRSIREVPWACSFARSTVREYLRRAREAGLP